MTTLTLNGPFVSRVSFSQIFQTGLSSLWAAFVAARRNRAMTLVSFYSAR